MTTSGFSSLSGMGICYHRNALRSSEKKLDMAAAVSYKLNNSFACVGLSHGKSEISEWLKKS